MNITTLWLQIYGGEHGDWPIPKLAEILADASFGLAWAEAGMVFGPGILCFSQVDNRLFDRVRAVSRNGQERVVALAPAGSALDRHTVWPILEAGASDVYTLSDPCNTGCHLAARFRRWLEVDELIDNSNLGRRLVGRSQGWHLTLRQAVEAARFTDAPVLVLGESGTGKELIARVVDEIDPRPNKPEMITLDCSTITPELSGSEFFGHERGAFTGAVTPRDGAFGLAHGGTLFLDEIGELPLGLQAKLLRVIQERSYKRVGGNAWKYTDFRLICATNRDLSCEVAQGTFREDLYFRIAGCILRLPPLRKRREDIIPLAEFFLSGMLGGRDPPALDDTVRDYLISRDYPGNVRDLRQLMTRIGIRHVGPGPVTVGDIPEEDRPSSGTMPSGCDGELEGAIRYAIALGMGLKDISHAAADAAIRLAIDEENGNLKRAAVRLGVTDRALQLRRAGQRSRLNILADE